MSLNWDMFLDAESINILNDQWSDPTAIPTGPLTSEMPKSITADKSCEDPGDITNFENFLNGNSVDPCFDDAVFAPNDYFLGDLEVLQFGNTAGGASTSESSPEPVSAINTSAQSPAALLAELNQLPQMTAAQRQALQRANTFPNPTYESMFPNNLDGGFVEDITFPNGPKGAATTTKPLDRTQSSNTVNKDTKRSKNKPDAISACWTSPLCPNHDQEGPPPNPSRCGGGCAPFLFANDDALPIITSLLTDPQEVTAADGIVEIQPRRKKRSESSTSMNEPSGRQLQSLNTTATTTSPTDDRHRMKSETSEDSPPHKESPDDKPKNRRRLPHNQVERKYRESLNTQLESLRRVVPSLQQSQAPCDGADIEDLPTPSKPSKAVILASATAHIKQQDKNNKALADENQLLKARIKALQALVKCDDCSLMQYVMDLKIGQGK